MAVISIREQIANLIELQAIDAKIYALNKKMQAIPVELEKKNKEFEAKKSGLNALEEKNKVFLVKKKDRELELAVKEEGIKKLQSQLFAIKTNKEYTALLKEIEGGKADKSLIEDQILGIFDELDSVSAEVNKEKDDLAREKKNLDKDKSEFDSALKTMEQELVIFNAKRSQVVPKIDRHALSTYERILKNKDGLAVVKVVDNSCHGCFMNVTHQTVNEIRMLDRLVTCEACSRILYEENG
ncbi:MAG: C4-type zinc ribbon domain-containing protein [Candidatus Omnitrophota bacterium]|nr:C4-type zinc ribbon domain-containing protein [Candidatus Omnitrophota bacterium]